MKSPDVAGSSAARVIAAATSDEPLYPKATPALAEQRRRLAPEPAKALRAFSQSVFAEGALPAKTKRLIAVAAAHVTQCPYCIRSHTRTALRQSATREEIMEAIWVAAEIRAGGASAHSALPLETIAHESACQPPGVDRIAEDRERSHDAHVRSAE